jgi:hypothetical protein
MHGVVDFLPIVDRGGWSTPLPNPEYFAATMFRLPGRSGLTWPERVDLAGAG